MPVILPGQTNLYALTDARLSLGRDVLEVARQLLEAGIRILQYREKKLSPARMLEECRELRKLTRVYGCCFIVNDYVDLAREVEADGLHIGQDDIELARARKALKPGMIIGLSTHSPDQARQAELIGADYIGVGPIFPTHTKEDVVAPVGFTYLDYVVNNICLPFVAIGGIKVRNIREVAMHGASCCAMVSELVGAENIAEKVREARQEMEWGMRIFRENSRKFIA